MPESCRLDSGRDIFTNDLQAFPVRNETETNQRHSCLSCPDPLTDVAVADRRGLLGVRRNRGVESLDEMKA